MRFRHDRARYELRGFGVLREGQKAYDVLGNLEMRLRIIVSESKTWRWLECIGFAVLGFAILMSIAGIVLTGTRHQASRHTSSAVPAGNPQHHEASLPAAPPAEPAVAVREQDTKVSVATTRVVQSVLALPRGTGEPRPGFSETGRGIRLRGKGSVVAVAVAEVDAAELLQHPDRLVDLIRSGSLFSVPNDTEVEIVETHTGLTEIHVLDGAFQGRDGWVRADQVVRK